MCKYVLIALLVVLIILMMVAAVVVQEYGWTGFLIMLGVLVVLAYIAKKSLPRLFRYLLTRPMRQMGAALRGARIVVHSISVTDAPEDDDFEDQYGEHAALLDHLNDPDDEDEEQPPIHYDWYHVEFTVFPPGPDSIEGAIRNRNGWSPDYIGARYIRVGKQDGSAAHGWPVGMADDLDAVQTAGVETWDGVEYVAPSETVFGDQRLRLHLGFSPGVNEATIVYAGFTEIGKVQLPRINNAPESSR